MIDRSFPCRSGCAIRALCVAIAMAPLLVAAAISPALAQTAIAGTLNEPNVSPRKIFLMLFLMLGPMKILVPFVNLTRNAEPVLQRRLASRAVLYSLAALALAGLLGRNILENFEISVPVLALTGGFDPVPGRASDRARAITSAGAPETGSDLARNQPGTVAAGVSRSL